jgi:hypothetical protein
MSNPTPLIQGKRSAYWLFGKFIQTKLIYPVLVKLSYDEYTQNHPDESVSVTAFSQTCMEKWRSMNKKVIIIILIIRHVFTEKKSLL